MGRGPFKYMGFMLFSVVTFAGAAVFALTEGWPWPRIHEAEPIVVSRAFLQTSDTLRPGETLGALFDRQGMGGFDLDRLTRELGLDSRRLRAGLIFHFRRATDEDEPREVVVRTRPDLRLRLAREAEEWELTSEPIAWTTETVRIAGDISSSLYTALDHHVSDEVLNVAERIRLAWDFADVFAWSIDFTRDLQAGDRFAAVVERLVSEEGEVRYGRVLAAVLESGGKPLTAFRFEGEAENRFYDAEGKSLRRAFLRAPVEFRRISSNFSRARRHPILGAYRRHAGTDYASSAGTPVMASGDGTVTRAGWSGGYGILVEIRHRNRITTRYAHLRGTARGIRAGARVRQSEVIGYVGATGLATAAHLHYEFLVNGVPQDIRRVKLDGGTPLGPEHRAAFDAERERLSRMLAFVPERTETRAD